MAPLEFNDQTRLIISCIFQDERDMYETDSPAGSKDDEFDPSKIAAKLRELGDHFDATVIKPLMQDVRTASQEQMESAFGKSVESLSKAWVVGRPEVVSEKQLLKASVALALYVKKNCPDLTGPIQDVMATFINNRLSTWILQQGGWEKATCSCV
ncbi:bcl-2-like protein 15 [Hoplias malabaricus]|uniref:bcl-2-like protein 15 n=1 Tax=Hoplias malabaricus TaxID=27720 RepID=UPI003462EA45